MVVVWVLFCFVFLPKTEFLCIKVLAVLELALLTRLASNSQRLTCFWFLSVEIKSVHHYAQQFVLIS